MIEKIEKTEIEYLHQAVTIINNFVENISFFYKNYNDETPHFLYRLNINEIKRSSQAVMNSIHRLEELDKQGKNTL